MTTNHIEETPAGVIDWKMEALRSARLLADAERIIAEYKAQAIEAARQPPVYDAMEVALEMSKPGGWRAVAQTEPESIWLQPWCDKCQTAAWRANESRQWCQDNIWDHCKVCGRKPVRVQKPPA